MGKILIILFCFICGEKILAQEASCFGQEKHELKIGSLMPYTKVKVGDSEGYFLIDFGTTASTIDTNGFINSKPKLASNSRNQFENFDFFGSWGTVTLKIQNHSNIKGIKQAGIIGTDFLCYNTFLLDYTNSKVLRGTSGSSCSDSSLLSQGFRSASTAGYYSNDLKKLNNSCTPNIPTVPIQIGKSRAVAQIDPGYDDKLFRHSININKTLYNAIKESGTVLVPNPSIDLTLSTCIAGLQEKVKSYKLPPKTNFSIIGVDGNAVIVHADVNIFLKETPEKAKECGGIGTWTIAAAQIGASFLLDSKKVIFDPFSEKVWFYSK